MLEAALRDKLARLTAAPLVVPPPPPLGVAKGSVQGTSKVPPPAKEPAESAARPPAEPPHPEPSPAASWTLPEGLTSKAPPPRPPGHL